MLHSRLVINGEKTAHVAFTDRRGGYSHGPYASLNLAGHVGDDPELVAANRSTVAQVIGVQGDRLSFVNQVHGNTVHLVHAGPESLPRGVVEADAQVTTEPGVGLVIMVADCTPVMLADTTAGVIGAVHAGRAGMASGVVAATVKVMWEQGAEDIRAVIGPSICPRCYEVPSELRAEVAAAEPVTASVSVNGTPGLDVAAGVAEQLHRLGVAIETWDRSCTAETRDLYSYRRDNVTGRYAGIIWLDENLRHT